MSNGPPLAERVAAMAQQVSKALMGVQRVIAAQGVSASEVRIVAVTKGFGFHAPLAAASCGLLDIGENFADELVAKAAACRDHRPDLRWHFLGALQTNKIRRLTPLVYEWHTADSVRRCDALADRAPGARVFVQVNLTGARSRGGCDPSEAVELVEHARGCGLHVCGLMGIGPDPSQSGEKASDAAFAVLSDLRRLAGVAELSAGMSDDFAAAVRSGARTIRLGSVLFGARPALDAPSWP